MEDKRKYVKEIRELRTELQACNRENESPNKQRGADHKVARIERLLAEKEEALDRLRIELETVAENNRNSTEMVSCAIIVCLRKCFRTSTWKFPKLLLGSFKLAFIS